MRKWKIAALLSLSALLLTVAGTVVYTRLHAAHSLDYPAVVTEMKRLNELVTVRYSIQRVVGLREQKVPLGEESILLMVQGEVSAGVDLDKLSPADVRRSGQKVIIYLPAPKILNASLDEKKTKIWDRHVTWWTPWVPYDPELEHKARLQALEDVRGAAMNMGILDEAERNAETAIRGLLNTFGFSTEFRRPSV